MTQKPIDILLVEDSPADVDLARAALGGTAWVRDLEVSGDGREALARLRGEGEYASHRRPSLVILDLRLPGMDGREVLAEIKADPRLRHIPVVILTSSRSEKDVRRMYELHANCYVCKPGGYREYVDTLRRLEEFWSKVAELPR